MTKTKRIKRYIVSIGSITWMASYGLAGNYVFRLNCGHETARKRSQGIPSFVYCRECSQLASGSVQWVRRGNVVETWNEVTGLPKREENVS